MPNSLHYVERLKKDNSSSYQLSKDNSFFNTIELSEAIKGFDNEIGGLHVCVICTDQLPELSINVARINETLGKVSSVKDLIDEDLIDEDLIGTLGDIALISEVLKLFPKYKNFIITEDKTGNWQSGNYVFVETGKYYCDVFNKILDFFCQLKKEPERTSGIIPSCQLYESEEILEEFCKTMYHAKWLTTSFISEEDQKNGCADIKVIFFLPQSFFNIFRSRECFFPKFIEYVILALSTSGMIKYYEKYSINPESMNKGSESKDKEIESKDKEIESKDKEIESKDKERLTNEHGIKDDNIKSQNHINNNDVSEQEATIEYANTEIKSNNTDVILPLYRDIDGR